MTELVRSCQSQRMHEIPYQQIRASYDEKTIRVYQAYSQEIADAALTKGTFTSPPFKTERMTWIKPSFLWMMYRSGWGYKDKNQCRILAINISRKGFEWALRHGCSSYPEPGMSQDEWIRIKANSPVRIQWDPERNLKLEPQPHRCIQIGLSKMAVELYIDEWIQNITDITNYVHSIHKKVLDFDFEDAALMLPTEEPYPTIASPQAMNTQAEIGSI